MKKINFLKSVFLILVCVWWTGSVTLGDTDHYNGQQLCRESTLSICQQIIRKSNLQSEYYKKYRRNIRPKPNNNSSNSNFDPDKVSFKQQNERIAHSFPLSSQICKSGQNQSQQDNLVFGPDCSLENSSKYDISAVPNIFSSITERHSTHADCSGLASSITYQNIPACSVSSGIESCAGSCHNTDNGVQNEEQSVMLNHIPTESKMAKCSLDSTNRLTAIKHSSAVVSSTLPLCMEDIQGASIGDGVPMLSASSLASSAMSTVNGIGSNGKIAIQTVPTSQNITSSTKHGTSSNHLLDNLVSSITHVLQTIPLDAVKLKLGNNFEEHEGSSQTAYQSEAVVLCQKSDSEAIGIATTDKHAISAVQGIHVGENIIASGEITSMAENKQEESDDGTCSVDSVKSGITSVRKRREHACSAIIDIQGASGVKKRCTRKHWRPNRKNQAKSSDTKVKRNVASLNKPQQDTSKRICEKTFQKLKSKIVNENNRTGTDNLKQRLRGTKLFKANDLKSSPKDLQTRKVVSNERVKDQACSVENSNKGDSKKSCKSMISRKNIQNTNFKKQSRVKSKEPSMISQHTEGGKHLERNYNASKLSRKRKLDDNSNNLEISVENLSQKAVLEKHKEYLLRTRADPLTCLQGLEESARLISQTPSRFIPIGTTVRQWSDGAHTFKLLNSLDDKSHVGGVWKSIIQED
ncbi:hypothetical protein ScPMuIL_018339 [Solemya velum]